MKFLPYGALFTGTAAAALQSCCHILPLLRNSAVVTQQSRVPGGPFWCSVFSPPTSPKPLAQGFALHSRAWEGVSFTSCTQVPRLVLGCACLTPMTVQSGTSVAKMPGRRRSHWHPSKVVPRSDALLAPHQLCYCLNLFNIELKKTTKGPRHEDLGQQCLYLTIKMFDKQLPVYIF